MGQQQLLLIVLGVIIVGIAVVLGIQLFSTHAIETKRENLINECIHLAHLAQKHFLTPVEVGGGSRSFVTWEIPSKMTSTLNGSYTIESKSKDELVLVGTANELINGKDSVSVRVVVTKDNYATEVIH